MAEARQIGNFECEVNQRFADGYGLVWLGRDWTLNVALMEKDGDYPMEGRLLAASKMEELQQKLHASAAEHFCIVASETLEDPSHGGRLAYLEKCDSAPEYIFTKNDKKSLTDFNKAVADGYRLVPGGIFGQVITLVKAPASGLVRIDFPPVLYIYVRSTCTRVRALRSLSCCIEVMILFRTALPKIAPSLVSVQILANHTCYSRAAKRTLSLN